MTAWFIIPRHLQRWFWMPILISGLALAGQPPGPAHGPGEGNKLKPRQLKIEKPEHPYTLPQGAGANGWTLFVKNDFKGAEAAFKDALKAGPNGLKGLEALETLEGFRSLLIYQGRHKEAQDVNLTMISASVDSPLCAAFAMRGMDAQSHTENRAGLLKALEDSAKVASPANKSLLMDLVATLHLGADHPEKAKAALKGLGYVNHWQFVCGPFGFRDPNNKMARRFAPERPLKELAFKDERGKKVIVKEDVPVPFRNISLGRLFPGARGVFYAFTNLQSELEQDVLILVGTSGQAQLYLRGMPVVLPRFDQQFPRNPDVIRTRLIKGANPLLVKLPSAGRLTIRIVSPEHAPVAGLTFTSLPKEDLAKHQVSPVRGFMYSQEGKGTLATYFLKAFKEVAAQPEPLKALASGGHLNVAQARWLEMAARVENDQQTREAVARVLVGSFPDSASLLDTGATVLASVGQTAGHTPSRHLEEARQLRERGLKLDPTSHQHLMGLYHFFSQRDLKEQAFEKIKACAKAHPNSAQAQEQLGQVYLDRNMKVLAQAQFEAAAKLDNAYLSRLASFHEYQGSRPRARELRAKMETLGMSGRMERFRRYLSTGQWEAAEKILAEHEKAYPDRKDDLKVLRAELLLEKGDLAGAYAIRRELVKAQPKNRAALISAVELALRLNKDEQAKALLRGFLKEHPGHFDLRQRLKELEGQESGRWWEPYDIKVDTVDASAFTQDRFPRSTYAWIVDFMVTKINPDLSQESYVHIAQKVLNLEGINELSEVLLQAQSRDLVLVRTLNPDGSSYQPENVLNFNLAQSASLYKVGPGSILEHAYLMREAANETDPSLNMAFNFMELDAPRAVSRWIVMVPKKADLKIRKIRPDLIEEKILEGPEGYTVYQWTNKKIQGIKVEPHMPTESDQEVVPIIFVETPPRPFQGTGWLQQPEQNFIPKGAEAVALQIAKRFKGEAMVFEAMAEWVRINIQPGKEARTLEDVWVLRSGNTQQMTQLCLGMCRAAGLNVRRAFVNGTYQPGKMWRTKHQEREWEPSALNAFGSASRMLVLEPESGRDVWLQFAGQPAEFFSVHTMFDGQAGALALVLGEEGVYLKRVHGEKLGNVATRHRITIRLNEQGGATLDGRLKFFGFLSGQLRRVLSNPQQAQKVPEGVLKRFWPRIEKPDIKISNGANIEAPLEMAYFGKVATLAEKAQGSLFLRPFPAQAALLQYIGVGERVHDLVIKNEWAELDVTLTYEAPAGFCWVEVPDDLFICTEFGLYFADFNVKGTRLTCNRGFIVPMQRVAPKKYAEFQAFLNRIAETAQQRVAYARSNQPGFTGLARPVLSMGYASHGAEKEEQEDRKKAAEEEKKKSAGKEEDTDKGKKKSVEEAKKKDG